jgi:hypothetical protein
LLEQLLLRRVERRGHEADCTGGVSQGWRIGPNSVTPRRHDLG